MTVKVAGHDISCTVIIVSCGSGPASAATMYPKSRWIIAQGGAELGKWEMGLWRVGLTIDD